MRPNLFSYAGGLGLVAGALLWPSIGHAQGFCYLINSEGEVVNLDELCLDNNELETPPEPGASDASNNASGEPQGTSSSSEVRSTTIISPAGISPAATSGSDEEPGQIDPNADDSETAPAGSESPQTPNSETTSDTPNDATEPGSRNTEPENRLDIPVREIETPDIPEIEPPPRLDSTEDDTNTSQ